MTAIDAPPTPAPAAAAATAKPARPSTHRLTLLRLVHSEWTKFASIRTLPLTLLAVALLVALPALGVAAVQVAQLDSLGADARIGFDPNTLALSGVPLALIAAGVLGALMLGGEYATGAIRTLMIVAPRRRAVLAAKAIVLVAVTLPAGALATAATFAGAQLILAERGLQAPVTAGLVATSLTAGVAISAAGLLGLALVTILRRTTGAITAFITMLLILPTLAGLVPGEAGRLTQRYLPSQPLNTLAAVSPAATDQQTLDGLTRRWARLHPTEAARGGIVAAVTAPDGTVLTSAAGVSSGTAAMQTGAYLQMASLTKTYVAAALLKARTAGLVDLDAPVRQYVADAPGSPELTVRMLLSQVSGLPDYIGSGAWSEAIAADPNRAWTPREILALVPAGSRELGTYEYSNTNYVVAGLVLEAVTGTDWGSAVRRLVLDPLGLAQTAPTGDGLSVVPGTIIDSRGEEISTSSGSYRAIDTLAGPAGGMVATTADLARFGAALLDGSALTDDEWRQMTAFGPKPGRYALGLGDFAAMARDNDGGAVHAIGNNGEIPGYGATMLLYPERGQAGLGTVVTVMRNDDTVDAFALAAEFATGLGVDRDPDALPVAGAYTLLLAYLLVFGGTATVLIGRRDV